MPNFRLAACLLSVFIHVPFAGQVFADTYPTKPIRMLTADAGGGADLMARLIAQGLTENLGRQVVVDNRGAASGAIAGEIVAKAAPDGYTILFFGPSIWLLPYLRANVPFDPVRDFAPITLAMTLPDILVVHPTVPAKSVKELIGVMKSKPGEINFSTGGTGSATHLAGELFKIMAGVNMVRVPYRGTGAALNALVGGQVHLMFPAIAAAIPHVKSGRLRALAVTSARATELAPGLPTVAEAALPGYDAELLLGVFAPAKTPASLIDRLNREIASVLQRADVKAKLFAAGAEGVGNSPSAFSAVLKADMAKWGKVIRGAALHD